MSQWQILVAEDSDNVSVMVDAALERDGRFEIYNARNGEQALTFCKQHHVDVAILDIMMPRMHGLKVCKILKSNPKTADIVVIMLSALSRQYTKNEAYEFGADAYLTKPFSPRELISTIDAHLQGRSPGEQQDAADGLLRGDVYIFNKGNRVTVGGLADGGDAQGVVRSRIAPGESELSDWGYHVTLDSGQDVSVLWSQVYPADSESTGPGLEQAV